MDAPLALDVVSTVGFPIAVCVYLLYERNRAIKDMTGALVDLRILIAQAMDD